MLFLTGRNIELQILRPNTKKCFIYGCKYIKSMYFYTFGTYQEQWYDELWWFCENLLECCKKLECQEEKKIFPHIFDGKEFGTTTKSITTLTTMTLSIMAPLRHSAEYGVLMIATFRRLCCVLLCYTAECLQCCVHIFEWHYAKCRYALCHNVY
jgi:hypothetical protein